MRYRRRSRAAAGEDEISGAERRRYARCRRTARSKISRCPHAAVSCRSGTRTGGPGAATRITPRRTRIARRHPDGTRAPRRRTRPTTNERVDRCDLCGFEKHDTNMARRGRARYVRAVGRRWHEPANKSQITNRIYVRIFLSILRMATQQAWHWVRACPPAPGKNASVATRTKGRGDFVLFEMTVLLYLEPVGPRGFMNSERRREV